MQWQPMQVPAGVPQQQVILQQQPMAAMNPYQQQVYWQQYYPQWTAVPAMQISQTSVQTQQPKLIQPPLPETSMAKPPLPPDSSGVGINPAPPVEPPKEEKPPLPPEPPPPEPTPPALPTVIALDFVISIAFSLFMNIYASAGRNGLYSGVQNLWYSSEKVEESLRFVLQGKEAEKLSNLQAQAAQWQQQQQQQQQWQKYQQDLYAYQQQLQQWQQQHSPGI